MKNIYITTTLPYVNAKPHIGFAREIIQADVLARFYRSIGYEVFFNTGTDEHGQKILQKAQEQELAPQQYVDQWAEEFRKTKKFLSLDYTRFIRTTDTDHIKAAQKFWQICDQNGLIYKKEYQTKYCVGCELEKTDSELINGKCPDHPNQELELREEENYFFKFSQFQKQLLELYANNSEFVVPVKRFNEIKKFVENGLEDFSISRLKEKMSWGVEVPNDSSQVMYVWFDALVNYISTLGWGSDDEDNFEKFWENSDKRIQFCGKDNLRQQSAMWQAMLLAAGIKNSSKVFVNGFVTVDGQKMSKSLGNVISSDEMVARYGTDGTRYLLLTAGSFGEDTDITWERMDEKYNADLANGLGNLVSRLIKLGSEVEYKKDETVGVDISLWENKISQGGFDEILKEIWGKIKGMDKLMEEKKPWELKKSNQDEFEKVMKEMLAGIEWIGQSLMPFLPEAAKKIAKAIKERKTEPLFFRL
ncbi:MAG TPA: methionine--tRNA ligase [Candidatus Moranbacteria bacterium]|nr:methionine--tRNA ligase [Candidatus Moranbacteria bacterium]